MKHVRDIDLAEVGGLAEGAVHLVDVGELHEYGGQVVVNHAGRLLLVNAEDSDWHCIRGGECDEQGRVMREAEGADWLEGEIIDLATETVVATFSDMIPDNTIHGPIYAAHCMTIAEGSDAGHYQRYLTRYIDNALEGALRG